MSMAQVEERARRTLLWSLSYLCRFQTSGSMGYRAKGDPIKADRMETQRRLEDVKKWGWKKTMEVNKVRLEASKLLATVLSKGKTKASSEPIPGHDLASDGMQQLLADLEKCESIAEAKKTIDAAVKAGTLAPEAGKTILTEMKEEVDDVVEARRKVGRKAQPENPLDNLMDEAVNAAQADAMDVEEESDDAAD